MTIELLQPFIKWLDTPKRYKIAFGGRGGGKTRQVVKLAILKSYTVKNSRIVFAREIEKNIKFSGMQTIIHTIYSLNLQEDFEIQAFSITNKKTNVEFIFLGLRDFAIDEKIKGIENISLFIVDEAQSLKERTYQVLEPSIRTKYSEIWYVLNPKRSDDVIYRYINSLNPEYKELSYKAFNNTYRYKEFEDSYNIITQINFDGNCYFNEELELERQKCIKYTPENYNHIWLGALETKQGRIFKLSRLKFYNTLPKELDMIPYRAIIDPAFGDKSCFHSIIIYKIYDSKIYIIDSGLIRGDEVRTNDEVILDFLDIYRPKQILIESNFAQGQLVKKIQRFYPNTKGFISNKNKIQRIIDNSISINEYCYFPEYFKTPPKLPLSEYTKDIQGRGYIFLQQILNFSDIEKENCIKGDDTSYIDGVDNLSNLIMQDRSYKHIVQLEIKTNNYKDLDKLWKKIN